MTDQQQSPKERVCEACSAVFIGNNIHSIKYVYVSRGPAIPIERFKLQVCSKTTNNLCLTKSLLGNNNKVFTQRPEYNKGFLTSNEINNIATSILKENGITMPDKYITINWIEGARKVPVAVDSVYFCTTYIIGIPIILSISIEFNDSTNEGYLTFLRLELIEVDLKNMEFNLYEGGRAVATAFFK